MRRMLLASILVLAPATFGFAQNTVRMEQVVQSYVSSAGFSGTVLVARGDSVVFRNGYGVSPDAASPVASITKQFTAAAILLLEERGRLRIDDLVSRHLPEAPAAWKTMTIFHLLTHTAGFQGLATPPAARRGLKSADGTVAGFVKAAMEGSLDAQPGETFNYTNSGYFILGHLIQKISGQSYERFIQDNIFTPLQMKETTLEKGAENPNTAAGFRSTTADLLRWQLALYGGKVLSAASLQRMTTSFKGDYGLGIYVRTIDGRKAMTHGGGVPTFANLTYFPETRTSVVVLGNPNPKAAPAPEIAAYLARWRMAERSRSLRNARRSRWRPIPATVCRTVCDGRHAADRRRQRRAAVGSVTGRPHDASSRRIGDVVLHRGNERARRVRARCRRRCDGPRHASGNAAGPRNAVAVGRSSRISISYILNACSSGTRGRPRPTRRNTVSRSTRP